MSRSIHTADLDDGSDAPERLRILRVHLRGRLPASARIAGDAGQGELDHRRVDGKDAAIPEARKLRTTAPPRLCASAWGFSREAFHTLPMGWQWLTLFNRLR